MGVLSFPGNPGTRTHGDHTRSARAGAMWVVSRVDKVFAGWMPFEITPCRPARLETGRATLPLTSLRALRCTQRAPAPMPLAEGRLPAGVALSEWPGGGPPGSNASPGQGPSRGLTREAI